MEGQVVTADPESVTIERSGAGDNGNVTLKRVEVARVFDGTGAGDMVFNGRNSWSDIAKVHPLKGERLRVPDQGWRRVQGRGRGVRLRHHNRRTQDSEGARASGFLRSDKTSKEGRRACRREEVQQAALNSSTFF